RLRAARRRQACRGVGARPPTHPHAAGVGAVGGSRADRRGGRARGRRAADGGNRTVTAGDDLWRSAASLRIAAAGALVRAAGALVTARPDVVVPAVPLALWAILVRPSTTDPRGSLAIEVRPQADQVPGRLREEIVVNGAGEFAELSITQAER